MKQIPPSFGKSYNPEQISEVLNLKQENIDSRFPVQEVATGLPLIIVPLRTLKALKKAKIGKGKYFELIKDAEAKAIFIFCPETHSDENDLAARMFADYCGI